MNNQTPHAILNIEERRENERALSRRGLIVWIIVSLLVFIFCLGVYFGFFAGKIIIGA